MRSDEASPLTGDERRLLNDLLAHDFPGAQALRTQVERVQARKGCSCGCGTIDLVPLDDDLPRSDAASPAPAQGRVFDTDGNETGGLLLFLNEGLLASLEVYSNDQPLPLPTADRVQWVVLLR